MGRGSPVKQSAGILMFRLAPAGLEVLLVHPGGPYWHSKDAGAWSIPKGEHDSSEEPLAAARRELKEEIGAEAEGKFLALGSVISPGRKTFRAWAVEADFDAAKLASNEVEIE